MATTPVETLLDGCEDEIAAALAEMAEIAPDDTLSQIWSATNGRVARDILTAPGLYAVRRLASALVTDENQLRLEWQERGGPPVVAQSRWGYCSGVIRALIPYEPGGTVELGHSCEGVRCNLEISTHWIADSKPPSQLHLAPRGRGP